MAAACTGEWHNHNGKKLEINKQAEKKNHKNVEINKHATEQLLDRQKKWETTPENN